MDALSHQIMGYLDSSQHGSKRSLKNLCHLVVLLDRYYEHKVKHLDYSLLLHMLSHLTEMHIESISHGINKDEYLSQKKYIEQLKSCTLIVESAQLSVFMRCVYFAEILLKTFQGKSKKPSLADTNLNAEITIDTEINKTLIDYSNA